MWRDACAAFLCALAERAAESAWEWLSRTPEREVEAEADDEPWWTRRATACL